MIFTEKYDLDTYLAYFRGREEFIACQGDSHYYPIKHSLDEEMLFKHIEGIQTFGIYVLTKKSQCYFICIDIDIPKNKLTEVDFKNPKLKFELLQIPLIKVINNLTSGLSLSINNLLFEDTGGRGYHVWIFFESPIDGSVIIKVNEILKKKYDFRFEFFPKQSSLNENRKYGNLIKLPLGEHKKYQQRSNFFKIENEEIIIFDSIESNIIHLKEIEKIKLSKIDEILENNVDVISNDICISKESFESRERKMYKNNIPRLLNNCAAVNQLVARAKEGNKLNYLEAFNLANILLSIKDSRTDLDHLLKSSYAEDYVEEVANREIGVIQQFQPPSCKSLVHSGICSKYCKPELEIRNEDPLQKNTNPLSVWLEPLYMDEIKKDAENILDQISDIENIKIAYSRLKHYNSKEAAVFYDEFDFDFFENDFDENTNLISLTLKNRLIVPNCSYSIVNVPKKLDEERKMVYRQMVYSSVFDQIVVQSIFNVIGVLLEERFYYGSYGYRLNITDKKSNKIFVDWKERYQEFRSNILNRLREPNIKFYLCCDIKAYYDNIRKEDLILRLRGIIDDEYVFGLLKNVITSYSSYGSTELGLPQGPAYARALANLYLDEFDKEISIKSNYYFRYVDDLFILFDSKEKADEVLELITKKLGLLDLTLSSDADKEAIVRDAEDEKIIIEKMDSLRYGVFEEAKFLPYLDKKKIKEFYDIASQKILPNNDSTKINNALPSLIYVYSKDINEDLESQNGLIEIIEQLSKNNNFFPKKYSTLFKRILSLYIKTDKSYFEFYNSLEDTHKIFFLLSLYERFQNEGERFSHPLSELLKENLNSDNTFLRGFAVAICERHKENLEISIIKSEIIDYIILKDDGFVGNKFFNTVDYFDLNAEEKNKISVYLKPSTNYLFKKYFFHGLKDFTKFNEIDTLLFENLLQNNYFLLHVECCKMISLFSSKNSLFKKLTNFISDEKVIYQSYLIDTLGNYISRRYNDLGRIELENLKMLYESDVDNEIKLRVLEIIARINDEFIKKKPSPIDDCNKIASYDECHYYQSHNNRFLFIEIIPNRKLKYSQSKEFQGLKKTATSLSDYGILPNCEIDYLAYDQSIIIKYFHQENYRSLLPQTFSWKKEEDCYNALLLANNINKKASKFYSEFNKFPVIKPENIKLIDDKFDIVFTNFGMTLCDSYCVKNSYLDNSNPNDICKNIYLFIFDLFFSDKNEWQVFEDEPKINISIFLWYILKRLKSNTISVQRLDYLIREIKQIGFNSPINICHFYFSERFRASLYENNSKQFNWKGVNKSVLDVFESLAVTYNKINFRDIIFENKRYLNLKSPRKIHYLCKELINLNLNSDNLLPGLTDKYSIKVFKLLNLYSVFCIELQSLAKIILQEKKHLEYINSENLTVIFSDIVLEISFLEVSNINRLIKLLSLNGIEIFDESVHYSLKEISFICNQKLTNQSFSEKKFVFLKPDNLLQEEFDIILDTFLKKIPRIEHSMALLINEINFSLSKNFQFNDSGIVDIKNIEDEIEKTLKDLKTIKRRTLSNRYTVSKFKINRFGNKVIIKKFLKKREQFSVGLSKGIPLTNLSPSHSSKFSYDTYKGQVINSVIPNERILILVRNLKKGKLFGYRFSYLYHKKSMLLFDFIGLLLFFSIETYMTLKYDYKTSDPLLLNNLFYRISHSSLWVVQQTFVAPLVFFVAKIFLYDLTFWFSNYPKFLNILKFKK